MVFESHFRARPLLGEAADSVRGNPGQFVERVKGLQEIFKRNQIPTSSIEATVHDLEFLIRSRNSLCQMKATGTGELELASAYSTLCTGLYFKVFDSIDPQTRQRLSNMLVESPALFTDKTFRGALKREATDPDVALESSLYTQTLSVAFDKATPDDTLSLGKLALTLKNFDRTFFEQLENVDVQQLVWSLLTASKYEALMKLSWRLLPLQKNMSSEDRSLIVDSIAKGYDSLSQLEQDILLDGRKFQTAAIKYAPIILEIRECSKTKGRNILVGLDERLTSPQ